MILGHERLESGCGDVFWTGLVKAPFDEKAVGQAAKHAQDPNALITLHSAPIVVVGDVQALVQTAFNAPGPPVQEQPKQRWQQRRLGAGD